MTKKAQSIPKKGIAIEWLPIEQVKPSDENPRYITKTEMNKLKESIKNFPQMMELRPGIVDANNTLIGGNRRHEACKQLGWKDFPVIRANNLTPEQLKEFMIRDNVSNGSWDTEELKTHWNVHELLDWGVDLIDVTDIGVGEIAPSTPDTKVVGKMKELRLKFNEKDHATIREELAKIADTPELALFKLIQAYNKAVDTIPNNRGKKPIVVPKQADKTQKV